MPKKTAVKTTKSKSKPVAAAKKVSAKNSVKETYSKTYTNMFQAYKAFWKRGFTEWAVLVNFIIMLMFFLYFLLILHLKYYDLLSVIVYILFLLYGVAMIIPLLSLYVRRLHDSGQSAWWLLLMLANFVQISVLNTVISIVFLVLMLLPTKKENNPYHKNNK